MNLKRITLGISFVILGMILWMKGEYFVGTMMILSGVLISLDIGFTVENKLVNYGLGICCLIGAMLFFFFPELAFTPSSSTALNRFYSYTGCVIFAIIGICIIVLTYER